MALQRTRGLVAAQLLRFGGRRSAIQHPPGGRSPLNAVAFGRLGKTLVAAVLVAVTTTGFVNPCTRLGKVDPQSMVRNADVIVVATAAEYIRQPETDIRTTGQPDSVIGFEVAEVLRGEDIRRTLALHGYLSDRNDFNDHPAPYRFVRPGGRKGSCFANTYKEAALFLLLLKKTPEGAYTVDWDPLAPVNEQLRSLDDPWVGWVKGQLAKDRSGK